MYLYSQGRSITFATISDSRVTAVDTRWQYIIKFFKYNRLLAVVLLHKEFNLLIQNVSYEHTRQKTL